MRNFTVVISILLAFRLRYASIYTEARVLSREPRYVTPRTRIGLSAPVSTGPAMRSRTSSCSSGILSRPQTGSPRLTAPAPNEAEPSSQPLPQATGLTSGCAAGLLFI